MAEHLLPRGTPGGGTVGQQGRAVDVPRLVRRLDEDHEGVGAEFAAHGPSIASLSAIDSTSGSLYPMPRKRRFSRGLPSPVGYTRARRYPRANAGRAGGRYGPRPRSSRDECEQAGVAGTAADDCEPLYLAAQSARVRARGGALGASIRQSRFRRWCGVDRRALVAISLETPPPGGK
jgi:hypothetical protein